jgi:ABC-type Fe3+ transport system substrate-binding protein
VTHQETKSTWRQVYSLPIVALAAISTLVGCGSSSGENSQVDMASMQALIASEMPNVTPEILKAACDEGQVNVSLDAETNYEQFAQEFTNKFPCVKASATVGEDDDILARFIAASAQGSPPDVVSVGSDISAKSKLADAGLMKQYEPSNAKTLHTVAPGLLFAPNHLSQGIMYNTNSIQQADMEKIKSWSDIDLLLDPKFDGTRLGMVDPHGAGGGSYMVAYVMHQTAGPELVEKVLKKLDVTVYAGSGPAVDALASGETDIVIGNDFNGLQANAKGAPIQVVHPSPGSNTYPAMGIAAKAKHPNAAILFEEFIFSKTGQALYPKILNTAPGRPDVEDTRPAAQAPWYQTASEPYDYNIEDMVTQYDDIVAPYPTK